MVVIKKFGFQTTHYCDYRLDFKPTTPKCLLGAKDKADNIDEIETACQPSAALPNDNGVSAKRRRKLKYKANKKARMEAE
ncbi:hypothetical protein MTR_7g034095 [Medicago truncatula]|uniref:Uncharacterized protein n=1 Tax=Medicago truncatula TaxID=3880 RepID=A0A072U8J9_MEDTR|nr:hypothetical protein MTR_7g034095 [Medicago truncatula]